MDVRRRLVGLALCSVMLIAGVPWTSSTHAEGALTIDGQYESAGPIGPGEVRNLVVTGRGGVPATGVGAVALNVTVTDPTLSSFITAWPTGAPRPTAANLNFVPGQIVPNMVVVKVGDFGQVSFFNYAGSANLVVDVMGWFPAGGYTGLTPARLADTRTGYPTIDGLFSGTGKVGASGVFDLPVLNRGGVPASGVGAVALNVTAVTPSASSFLTVYPTGATRPTSANLNYVAGDVVPNMVIVKVGDLGKVSMFNYAGNVDLVVDVMGWFPDVNSFNGLTPARLMDTRGGYPTIDSQFAGAGAIAANSARDLVVTGRGGVPASGVGAVVLNVTATNPTAPSFLTVFPAGSQRPLAANLNFVAGQTVANMVIAKVGADGKISIYNYGGNVDVVVDIMGWFPTGVAYEGLVPARLMDTRPGGNPTTPTLPTTTVPGATTTTLPGSTTVPAPTTTVPPEPPQPLAPWTEQAVAMPTTPRNDTPRITDGEIFDIETVGTSVYVLGSFTNAADTPANGGAAFAQRALIKYNRTNGLIDRSFHPDFGAAESLTAIAAAPNGAAVYVTGTFNTVDGVARRKIVKLDAVTGMVDGAFVGPNFDARATAVVVSNNWVYVGGQFATPRASLAALDPTTGALDAGFNLPITGGIGTGGLLNVQALVLSHDVNQSSLVVVHTGRQIAGQDRYGVGLVDTVNKSLLPWQTNLFSDNLAGVGGVIRVYAADIAPDDSYFVVTSGSGGDRPPLSDVAIAFTLAGGAGVQPLWNSRSFDSVYSVAITTATVFIGGHFSWQESPRAADPWPGLATVGYGTGQGLSGYALGDQVVRRDQLSALDPMTGKAQEWNPGANAFEGVKALDYVPGVGLFVGADATTIGGRNVSRTAFFDLNDAVNFPVPGPNDAKAIIVSPYDGLVVPSDQPVVLEGTATAGNGNGTVVNVRVEVQRKGSTQYLCANGTFGTQSACPNIPAVLASTGAAATNWTLTLNLPVAEYYIRARTFTTGPRSPSARTVMTLEAFRFDDATPDTAISLPLGGQVTTNTFTVTGTAVDDHGVASMSYYAENLDTRQYLQDDGTTASAYNSFEGLPDAPGQTNATWTLELTLPNGNWRLVASAIDTAGQADLRGAARQWIVDPTGQSPTVTITSPVTWNPPVAPATSTPSAVYGPVAPGSVVTFTGTAADDTAVKEIDVALRNNSTGEALAADGTWGANVPAGFFRISQPATQSATWSFSPSSLGISLSPGVYTFRVRAIDNVLLVTTTANTASVSMTVQVSGDAFPTETINGGPSGLNPDQSVEALHLDLSGTASDNAGVNNVRVVINDLDTATYLTASGGPMSTLYTVIPAVLGSPGAASTTWSLSVNLPAQGEYNVTVTAVDSAGQFASAGATWRYLIYPGDTDPVLVASLNSPPDVSPPLPTGGITIGGRGEDDNGMSTVRITIRNGSNLYFSPTTNTFAGATAASINAFLTSLGSPGSNFNYATPQAAAAAFPAGTYTITVTPFDNWGQAGLTRTVAVTLA